mmetsp:Transcript_4882/g.14172  ORF Transcript_4882/g.14172 Transcript_4882/m.14172 type:complete len:383 (+) Transcript_4882:104-1252(+)
MHGVRQLHGAVLNHHVWSLRCLGACNLRDDSLHHECAEGRRQLGVGRAARVGAGVEEELANGLIAGLRSHKQWRTVRLIDRIQLCAVCQQELANLNTASTSCEVQGRLLPGLPPVHGGALREQRAHLVRCAAVGGAVEGRAAELVLRLPVIDCSCHALLRRRFASGLHGLLICIQRCQRGGAAALACDAGDIIDVVLFLNGLDGIFVQHGVHQEGDEHACGCDEQEGEARREKAAKELARVCRGNFGWSNGICARCLHLPSLGRGALGALVLVGRQKGLVGVLGELREGVLHGIELADDAHATGDHGYPRGRARRRDISTTLHLLLSGHGRAQGSKQDGHEEDAVACAHMGRLRFWRGARYRRSEFAMSRHHGQARGAAAGG